MKEIIKIKIPCNKCGAITEIEIMSISCSLCLNCVSKLDTLEKIKEEIKRDYLFNQNN